MLLYRFGRFFQVLAIIDCALALYMGLYLPEKGFETQIYVLIFAVVLFGAGRLLQKWGMASLPKKGAGSPRAAGPASSAR
ncbi:MAG: hypothetical protein O2807_10060 [bacterium]|nr:hypothetical protein [bacterium]